MILVNIIYVAALVELMDKAEEVAKKEIERFKNMKEEEASRII